MNENLGKVRPEYVKKIARELLKMYPDKFTVDFQSNKEAVASLTQISSSKLRNRIAGYLTSLVPPEVPPSEEIEREEDEVSGEDQYKEDEGEE
jgi:small subunit ribosomal protein S17e